MPRRLFVRERPDVLSSRTPQSVSPPPPLPPPPHRHDADVFAVVHTEGALFLTSAIERRRGTSTTRATEMKYRFGVPVSHVEVQGNLSQGVTVDYHNSWNVAQPIGSGVGLHKTHLVVRSHLLAPCTLVLKDCTVRTTPLFPRSVTPRLWQYVPRQSLGTVDRHWHSQEGRTHVLEGDTGHG